MAGYAGIAALFESFGTPDWVMKTVLVLMAIGLLFALFFAWAFELTPEGIKREKEVDRSQSITPQTGKKLNNTIFLVMALAIVDASKAHCPPLLPQQFRCRALWTVT